LRGQESSRIGPTLRVLPTVEHERGRIRVAVADDSYLIREAIGQILGRMEGVDLVATCADGDALWAAIEAGGVEAAIVDMRMPPSGEQEGIEIARRLRQSHPRMGVVLLSQYAEPRYGLELMSPSAVGRAYLLKDRIHDRAELESAIWTVARGGTMIDPSMVSMLLEAQRQRRGSAVSELTRREQEVLGEMAQGKSNAAIADSLTLTKRAVEKHVGSIFMKLELSDEDMVSRRVAAVLLYLAEERR
jgi:DNA-binding NarL/FixJ family response regulator